MPWVVLSAAVSHETFRHQVEIACQGGAGGFLAGRSIWKEALDLPAEERRAFLAGEATRRLAELTAAAGVPWVVLSAAVSHEKFRRQVEIACAGGAGGFLAGRSIWKEAPDLPAEERRSFLAGEATRRLEELTEIARRAGRPWTEYYAATTGENWFMEY